MKQYEVTFIVDPVLSGDEVKRTVNIYSDMVQKDGGAIVHIDDMGLKPLAYPINKKSTGVYYTIEFQVEGGASVDKMELAMRRDDRIMRYLTVKLDKYGVKYNEDKRAGKIGKREMPKRKDEPEMVVKTKIAEPLPDVPGETE